jgi:hypothetical protein
VRRVYADGDTVIVFFDADGTARDGQPYSNTYAWFLTVQDGRIVEALAFVDSVESMAGYLRCFSDQPGSKIVAIMPGCPMERKAVRLLQCGWN